MKTEKILENLENEFFDLLETYEGDVKKAKEEIAKKYTEFWMINFLNGIAG